MIVGDVIDEPIGHFILMAFLDITPKDPDLTVTTFDGWTASLPTASVLVRVSSLLSWKPLQNQESGKTECSLEAPLEYSWVDS